MAKQTCDSLMDTYTAGELPQPSLALSSGVFLAVWNYCGSRPEDRYIQYIQQYVDDLVDENGNLYLPVTSWMRSRQDCCCSRCMNGPAGEVPDCCR
jgi:rhamnogalacturonyl hydrolase YesR